MAKSNNPLNDPKNRSAETQLVHGGVHRTGFNETSEAIFMNSGYSYPNSQHAEDLFLNKLPGAHNYSRFANPTVDVFQERMALLEGAEAGRAFATGMAAVTNAVMSQVRAGDHIVAARSLFGGCRYVVEDLMPRIGLVVLSSISEALPLVILEGYAAGVPTVSTDVGSCRQLIEGLDEPDRALGASGSVVGIADPQALADAAIALLRDPAEWNRASQAAIARVERYYTDSMMFGSYRNVYQKALGETALNAPHNEEAC